MSKKTGSLTYERATEILRYDAETGLLERKLKSGRWCACGDKPNRGDGRGRVTIDGKMYLTHRLIWLLVHGYMPKFIDHIDRNPMNNRLNNLRAATRTENQHNHGLHRDNSSGYLGVSFHKASSKYQAAIRIHGKKIHIGLYPTAEEAFTAYMLAKIQYHPTSPISQEYLRELTLVG